MADEECNVHAGQDSDEQCPECMRVLDEYVKNERLYLAREIARIATNSDESELVNTLDNWPLEDLAFLEQFCARIGGKTRGYANY